MGVARVVRVLVALLVACGWAAVLAGLYLQPVSEDPELDLEAGGSFAAGLTVYLPALALSVVLVVTVVLVLLTSRTVAGVFGTGAGVVVTLFAWWVSAQDYLTAYVPGLTGLLWPAALLGVAAAVVSLVGLVLSGEPAGAAASEDHEAAARQ